MADLGLQAISFNKMAAKNWYNIENIDTIDSPALIIYKERVQENINLLIQLANNDVARLRPHVKTSKIAEVCAMMMAKGITKFKCATIAEAEMLATINAPDVLLSYQPVGPKAERFFKLVSKFPLTHFSCLIDNIQTAAQLSQLFSRNNSVVDVIIDLNTGMNRTGIHPGHAIMLFEAVQLLPGINVIGLHAYDGNILDKDIELRTQHTKAAYSKVIIVAETINAITGQNLIIVAGGSPTFPVHVKNKNIECSAGTFVFWDWGYKQNLPEEPFDFAALVVTRIISIVDNTTITTDLGHKSVAAENPLPRVHFLNAPDAVAVSQSEEHLVAKVSDASIFKPGDVLYGVPVHICPTVALYDKAIIIENNIAVGEWEIIARKRSITI